jgi:hypothetical protein
MPSMTAIDTTRQIATGARRLSTNPALAVVVWLFAFVAILIVWTMRLVLVMVVIAWDLVNLMLPRL